MGGVHGSYFRDLLRHVLHFNCIGIFIPANIHIALGLSQYDSKVCMHIVKTRGDVGPSSFTVMSWRSATLIIVPSFSH